MRPVLAALAPFLVLAACAKSEPDLEITRFGGLDKDATAIDFGEQPRRTQSVQYRIGVRSRLDRGVKIAVRHEGEPPEGAGVRFHGATDVLPHGEEELRLAILLPRALGPFSGTFTIHAEGVPGWRRTVAYEGTMVDAPLEGRYLFVRPPGVDLGEVEEGTAHPFLFTVVNGGSEPLLVKEWRIFDESRMRLRHVGGGETIQVGAELPVNGMLQAPREPGPFRERVQIVSDAENGALRDVVVTGVVIADYAAQPPRLDWRTVFRTARREVEVRLAARPEAAPFTVAAVDGAAPYFEVVDRGGAEPAAAQVVKLRMRADAPLGVVRDHPVRFRLEPGPAIVTWPVSLNVVASIYAQPGALNFERVERDSKRRLPVHLASFRNKPFRVTAAQTRNRDFLTEIVQPAGLAPIVYVTLRPGAPTGVKNDVLLIETDDDETPRLQVRVRAVVY